jgi:hypothetical protein
MPIIWRWRNWLIVRAGRPTSGSCVACEIVCHGCIGSATTANDYSFTPFSFLWLIASAIGASVGEGQRYRRHRFQDGLRDTYLAARCRLRLDQHRALYTVVRLRA